MRQFTEQGKYLKKVRVKNSYTQIQVGKIVGCNSQFISNAERELCTLPGPALKLFAKHIPHFDVNAYIRAAAKDAAEAATADLKRKLK